MVVAKSSSHRRKYFKYNTSTAAKQEGEGEFKNKKTKSVNCIRPRKQDQLTSHAIVGEALTELIDHNEEDAYRVTKDRCLL